jgi:hypothetical protein
MVGPDFTIDPLDDLPLAIFPDWAARYVEEKAWVLQVDPTLVALSVLVATSLAIHAKAEIHVRGDWIEQTGIWTCAALRSGNRKSPALYQPLRPVREWEREECERRRAYHDRIQSAMDLLKPTQRREMRIYKLAQPPLPFLVYTSDVTPEALAEQMARAGGCMGVVSDEPTSVAKILTGLYGAQGQTANAGIYMAAYTGSDYRRHRVKAPDVILRRPSLVLGLIGQPSVLDALCASEELIDLGFVGRMIVSLPRDMLGDREIHAGSTSAMTEAAYRDGLRAILDTPSREPLPIRETIPSDPEPWPTDPPPRYTLELDGDATAMHMEAERLIEPMLATQGLLGELSDFGGKLSGTIARVAALLHALHYTSEWQRRAIGEEALHGGVLVGRYALGQVLRLHSGARREAAESALVERVYAAAREECDGHTPPMVTLRALTRRLIPGNGRGKIKSVDQLLELVDILETERRFVADHASRGRRWLVQ